MRLRAADAACGSLNGKRIAVIGAGIAGLAAAYTLLRESPGIELIVIERSGRVGGLIESEHAPGGFLLEHGADCLLTTKPWGIDAVHRCGLDDDIVAAIEPRRSYIAAEGRLIPLPPIFSGTASDAAVALARTPLLTRRAKARLALEPLVPRRRGGTDESVATFVTRRFGAGMLPRMIEPLLGGVYGGAATQLSVDACLPQLRAMERQVGSVLRGVRRAQRHRAGNRADLPEMVSLRGGMASLPTALAHALGKRIQFNATTESIARSASGFRLTTSQGSIACDGAVLAVPAWAGARLLESLDATLAGDLAAIPHSTIDCVTMAWPVADWPIAIQGSGFVTASDDGRPTRACTWASHKWPGRAPAGWVLVRSVMRNSAAATDSSELIARAQSDLREIVGVERPPALLRVRRLPQATPVYTVGHLERVAGMHARAAAVGPLVLAGNAIAGIGIPDCIHSGITAGQRLASM